MKYEDENHEIIEDNELPVWILPFYNRLNNKKKKRIKVEITKKRQRVGYYNIIPNEKIKTFFGRNDKK